MEKKEQVNKIFNFENDVKQKNEEEKVNKK